MGRKSIDLKPGEEVILSTPGLGTSKWLGHILAEKGLSMEDVIVIDHDTFADKDLFIETIKNSENKIVLIEDINLLVDRSDLLGRASNSETLKFSVDEPKFQREIEPDKSDVVSGHPFKKFIGKPNWKK